MKHRRRGLPGTPPSVRRRRAGLTPTALLAACILTSGLVLAACGPTPEPQTLVETVVVEQTRIVEKPGEPVTVVETVEVQVVVTPEATQSEGPTGGECCDAYRIGMYGDPGTLNMWAWLGHAGSFWTWFLIGDQFLTLYRPSDVTFQFVPCLAKELAEPVANGDGTWSITVEMVEDATWSDGTPITAHDYAFTFNTSKDLRLPNDVNTYAPGGLEATVEAVDDYTLEFRFLNQAPSLGNWQWGLASNTMILPKHFWADTVAEAHRFVDGVVAPEAERPTDCEGDGLSAEEQDACGEWAVYDEAFANARRTLYEADATGMPSAGAYVVDKWEIGTFAQKTANDLYYFKGAEIVEYEDGTWMMIHPNGTTHQLYGDAQGEEIVRFTDGPHAPRVLFSIYDSQEAAYVALAAGEVDYVLDPMPGLSRGIQEMVQKTGEGIETYKNAGFDMAYLAFNMRKYPMSEPEFRQAVDILLDKEFVINSVLGSPVIPLYSTMPPGNLYWYNPDVPRPYVGLSREERVNLAVEVLKEGGWSWAVEPTLSEDGQDVIPGEGLVMPNGEPMPEITVLGPGPAWDPIRATFNQWTSEWMRELGMPVRSELSGFNNILGPVFVESSFDMYILTWGLGNMWFPTYYEDFWHSRNDTALSGRRNTPGYHNPEYDALIDEFMTTADRERARELIFEAQMVLAEDRPYIPLFSSQVVEFARDNIVFPYTEALGGIQWYGGLQSATQPLYK